MSEPELETTLNYELTRWDVFQGRLQSVFHNRLMLAILTIPLVMPAFGAMTDPPEFIGSSLFLKLIATLIVLLITAAILVLWLMVVFGLTVLLWKNSGLVGKHTLIIKREGLFESTDFNETLHKWTYSYKIRETSGYLYIYLTQHQFYHVPKRCFTSSEHIKSFIQELKSHAKPTA